MQSPLHRSLRWLGAAALAGFVGQTLISYLAAPLATYGMDDPDVARFHGRFANAVAAPDTWLHAALRGQSPLADRGTFIAAYATPSMIVAAIAIGVLFLLYRRRDLVTPATGDSLLRWSYAFAAVTVPALPVLVPDFWLSVAWGRLAAEGGNPYYLIPPGTTEGLPLGSDIMSMTYGPLWALLCGAVMWLAGGSALWGTVLFKLLLGSAWIAVLRLVSRLMAGRDPWERSAAIVATGWLPVGVVQTVGDGHNDAVMVVLALAWLVSLEAGAPLRASALLAASVMAKYVTAPLFLLDLLAARHRDGRARSIPATVREYAPRALVAAIVVAVAFAPFFRSTTFFAQAADVQSTWFFLPANAVLAIGALSELPLRPLAYAVMLIFPVVTAWLVARYVRDPSPALFRHAVAGMMASVLFVAARHVWPWYVLWLLPFAVLDPGSRLARWSIGVGLAAPLLLLPWTAYPRADAFLRLQLPSLIVYGFALAWMAVAPRGGRDASRRAQGGGREPSASSA